ncbi:MAG: PhoD-like phosphatase N-terminal domain-containing protein [Verrucomicrobiota bacterium]
MGIDTRWAYRLGVKNTLLSRTQRWCSVLALLAGAGACLPTTAATRFLHGVASGDPAPDSVVLWTRATPDTAGPPRSFLTPRDQMQILRITYLFLGTEVHLEVQPVRRLNKLRTHVLHSCPPIDTPHQADLETNSTKV